LTAEDSESLGQINHAHLMTPLQGRAIVVFVALVASPFFKMFVLSRTVRF